VTEESSGGQGPRLDHAVERMLPTLPYLSLLGLALLVANVFLSFEVPHTPMLVGAALLIVAAPTVLLIHLATTPQLSRAEKRMWVRGLVSRNGPALFAAYFNARQRSRLTSLLASGIRGQGGEA
jgi:hypothetical protein